jgi:hypothetical protein
MADKDDKKTEEPEIEVVEVDDAGKPLATGGQAEGAAQASGAAEPADHEDDETPDEERLRLNADDPEARKAARKLKDEKRRQLRQRDALELRLLKQQNAEMAQRLAAVEVHTGRQDLSLIDDRLANAKKLVQQADQVLADAVTKQDGRRAAEAMKVRDDARDQVQQLSSLKVQLEHRARQEPAPVDPRAAGNGGLPPAVAERVNAFQRSNPWYDPAGRDVDSGVIQRLDQAVADDGYDPANQDYWDELAARAAKYLPHRFAGEGARQGGNGQRPAPRSGPPMNGGGEATTTVNGKKMVYITPARKAAMIEAGAWEDPVRRQRMLKQYERYDRENPPQRGTA